jgi:putative ABC transport system substrate-binding protein
MRRCAAELVGLAPDVILARGGTTVGPLQQATTSVPIVFVNATDPVGAGFVGQPGTTRRATRFLTIEYGMSGKWLELLKEIAPQMTQAAVVRDAAATGQIAQYGAIQAVAPAIGVELSPINARHAGQIEHALAAFACGPHCGLIVTALICHRSSRADH